MVEELELVLESVDFEASDVSVVFGDVPLENEMMHFVIDGAKLVLERLGLGIWKVVPLVIGDVSLEIEVVHFVVHFVVQLVQKVLEEVSLTLLPLV